MLYSDEQKRFIKEHYKEWPFKILTEKFNQKFGTTKSCQTIKCYCSKHKLKKTDGDGTFQNGHPAWNKGFTKNEYLQHCTDETRKILAKHKPPEYAHIRKYNIGDRILVKAWNNKMIPYIVISLEKTRIENRIIPETRYVWEKYNGPVPKGHYIIHIDGDPMNNDISNLQIVSERERNIIIANEWTGNKEIFETGLMIAKLKNELINFGMC